MTIEEKFKALETLVLNLIEEVKSRDTSDFCCDYVYLVRDYEKSLQLGIKCDDCGTTENNSRINCPSAILCVNCYHGRYSEIL